MKITNNCAHSFSFEPTEEDIKEMARTSSLFPLSYFPPLMQQLIEEANGSLGFPIDYFGSSILVAVASAIGNNAVVEVKPSWREKAVLYMVVVGSAGANKSHPMSWAMEPLLSADVKAMEKYQAELKHFKEMGGEPPLRRRRVVSDTTLEGLISLHSLNSDGLVLFVDELKGWIDNFNRYTSSSQEQFWLSNFSSKPIIVDRQDTERSLMIKNPFICVLGSTQSKVLSGFAKGDKAYNGFLDRLLFSIIEKADKPYWSQEYLNPTLEKWYHNFIADILRLGHSLTEQGVNLPLVVRFSPESFALMIEWQRYNADLVNSATTEGFASMQIKLESYVIRLALVSHLMRYYATTGEVERLDEIDIRSMQMAIRLVEYYRVQGFTVREIIEQRPEDNMPLNDKAFFEKLPTSFSFQEVLAVASEIGISRHSANRLLRKYDGKLVVKVGYNKYVLIGGVGAS